MTPWALSALASPLVMLLLYAALLSRVLRAADRRARGLPSAELKVLTEDGWPLRLLRYQGKGQPVLLCHGIGSSSRNLDLSDEHSFARALHRRGHDTWLLDLRGCGGSRRGPRTRATITFDDFVNQDGPRAISAILEATGASKLHWVGFSMGGIIGAALLGGPCGQQLQSLSLIGSPLRVGPSGVFGSPAGVGRALLRWHGSVPLRLISRLAARLPRRLVAPFVRLLINPANVAWSSMRLAMDQSVEDIPMGLLEQMNAWRENERGHAGSLDHGIDYIRRLRDAPPVPLFSIIGTGDRLGPLIALLPALEHHGGPAQLRIVGRDADEHRRRWAPEGSSVEVREHAEPWRHADLVLGDKAPAEVFAAVGRFVGSVSR